MSDDDEDDDDEDDDDADDHDHDHDQDGDDDGDVDNDDDIDDVDDDVNDDDDDHYDISILIAPIFKLPILSILQAHYLGINKHCFDMNFNTITYHIKSYHILNITHR